MKHCDVGANLYNEWETTGTKAAERAFKEHKRYCAECSGIKTGHVVELVEERYGGQYRRYKLLDGQGERE